MNSKPVIFIAGVVLGAALYAGGHSYFTSAPAASTGKPDVVKNAEAALADVKKRTALLDEREKLLAARELQLADAGAPDADKSTPTPDAGRGAAMSKMAGAMIKQQMDMQMNAMKSRLNLTDDQTKTIQAIMDKQAQFASDMAEKMMSGKMSQEDMQKAMEDQGGPPADLEAQLKDILSTDQYAQYQTYQNDQKKSMAELQANAELAQIQSSLQLTEDQKDKVFGAIYSVSAQQMGVDGAKSGITDPNQALEAKKAALQAVLTPEQFDTYSKYVDSQKAMINALMGGVNGGQDTNQNKGDTNVTSVQTIAIPVP